MKRQRSGQTLVEVAVATVITAAAAMAVFSVVLSSFASQTKGDKNAAAGFALKQAQQTLKSYVSADPTNANPFSMASSPLAGAPGASTSVGHWAMETVGTQWALAAGTHDVTRLLNGTVLNPTSGGSGCTSNNPPCLRYVVKNIDCGFGFAGAGEAACKEVVFTLIYADD